VKGKTQNRKATNYDVDTVLMHNHMMLLEQLPARERQDAESRDICFKFR
jgi:hypothetical protein